ncbi:hypothetical protein ElyMa_006979800 [Elysia marginata]|uniref:HORMA domain-containing protein n=1 Tax=Elysia marginata TaxID=1093978 RepID=A0AAV4JME3_9GAST|nr:hypothetical protein ElyMa_006979800 [Elysia marginata]
MGLDLLPFLEDHALLVAHNNRIFKLKLYYEDQVGPRDKSCFVASVLPQEAHNQIEEVLRAVLYILERDTTPIPPIQTNNFVVHPRTEPWGLANKIEFVIDDKVMHCYQDCLIFRVHCKPLITNTNTNAGISEIPRELDNGMLPLSKEEDALYNHTGKAHNMHAEKTKSIDTEETCNSTLPMVSVGKMSFRPDTVANKKRKSTLSLSVTASETRNDQNGQSKHSEERESSSSCLIGNENKKSLHEDQVSGRSSGRQSQNARETRKSPRLNQLKTILNANNINKNKETKAAQNVTENAMNCNERSWRKRILLKKAKGNVDNSSDCHVDASGKELVHGNANNELQNRNLEKEKMLGTNLNSFEMQDSDMVELYHHGSIIVSPLENKGEGQRRKRQINYSDDCENGNKVFKVQEQYNLRSRSSSRKKHLCNGCNYFTPKKKSDDFKTGHFRKSEKLSNTAHHYYRQKLVQANKARQNQHSSSSSSASNIETKTTNSSRSEKGFSPMLNCSLNDKNKIIIKQHKKLLENGHKTQAKCGLQENGNCFNVTADKTTKVTDGSATFSVVKKSPKMSSSFAQQHLKSMALRSGTVVARRAKPSSHLLSHVDKGPGNVGNGTISSTSRATTPRQNKQNALHSEAVTGSDSSLPQKRKRSGAGKSLSPRSDSKLEVFRLTRKRLLAGRDGVWLLPTALFSQASITKKKKSRRKTRSPVRCYVDQLTPSFQERSSVESALLDLTRKSHQEMHSQEAKQPSKFFQVLTSIFGASNRQ